MELSVMAEVVARDARSTVAGNLSYLASLTHLACSVQWRAGATVKLALPVKDTGEGGLENWTPVHPDEGAGRLGE